MCDLARDMNPAMRVAEIQISSMPLETGVSGKSHRRFKMPQYSFRLMAICEVIVTADNEEQAGLLAAEETPISAYSFESGEMACLVTEENHERCVRHADYVIA